MRNGEESEKCGEEFLSLFFAFSKLSETMGELEFMCCCMRLISVSSSCGAVISSRISLLSLEVCMDS